MSVVSIKKTIESYCKKEDITIPPGFYRNSASRFGIVRKEQKSQKLVGTTWFKKADLSYYIQNFISDDVGIVAKQIDIYDFKDLVLLSYEGPSKFSLKCAINTEE